MHLKISVEIYSQTSMSRTPLGPGKYVSKRVVRASVNHSARTGGKIEIQFRFSLT